MMWAGKLWVGKGITVVLAQGAVFDFESHHSWATGNPFLWGFSMMETQP